MADLGYDDWGTERPCLLLSLSFVMLGAAFGAPVMRNERP